MESKLFKQLLKEDKEFAVKVSNEKECNELLKLCDRQNVKWFMGERALEYNPYNENVKDIIYITFEKYRFATLMRYTTDKKFCLMNNIKEVKFEDLFKPYINQEIHITRKGNKVHAILKEDGEVIKRSMVKCHPEDEFDFKIGSKLAYDRLFGEELKKEQGGNVTTQYLNCKFIALENMVGLTKGEIYEVNNGKYRADDGNEYPLDFLSPNVLRTKDELLKFIGKNLIIILND